MGEAKRRKATGSGHNEPRSWAIGSIEVIANGTPCFDWRGTRQEAAALQKAYLDTIAANSLPISAQSYARRVAGYLMVYGLPAAGDADQRPSRRGERWEAAELELYKCAVLWLALRERVNAAQTIEDVFVGKMLAVTFVGDKAALIDYSEHELRGETAVMGNFQMTVQVLDHHLALDPQDAIAITYAKLHDLAGNPLPKDARLANEPVYVPRIPVEADEAKAMLKMTTIVSDMTPAGLAAARAENNPAAAIRTYAGYTEDELRGGKVAVSIR